MAEQLQFSGGKKGLDEAVKVFSDLPWKVDGAGKTFIFDEKADKYVPVTEGDYIVHIGKRYEVSDTEPEKAKEVEVPEEPVDEYDDESDAFAE